MRCPQWFLASKMAIAEAANTSRASNGRQEAAVDSKNIPISQFPAVILLGPICGGFFGGYVPSALLDRCRS